MTERWLAIVGLAVMPLVVAATGETASPSARGSLQQSSAAAPDTSQSPRALVDRYCVGCHGQKAKAAGQDSARKLTLDDVDMTQIAERADVWERVVRKLRAGMMPPAGVRRPDK